MIELVPCLLIGFLIGRRYTNLPGQLAVPLVRFGVPFSVMGLLLKGGLTPRMVLAGLIASSTIGLTLTMASTLPTARQWLIIPCLRCGSCIGNTAYFGVPVALALLPPSALPVSIGYDLGATLLTWSLGPLIMAPDQPASQPWNGRSVLASLLSSPALRGLIGALLVTPTPWRESITEALWLPSRTVILVALAVLGMRLGSLVREGHGLGSARMVLLPALISKLLLFPALMLVLASCLQLEPVMAQALALQAAAPTAISILLIAEAVDRDQALAAGLVLWSTIIAVFSTPLWGLFLRGLYVLPGQ